MNFLLKPKFLLWIIGILLIINIATFWGIFITQHNKHDKSRFDFFSKLELNKDQENFFNSKRNFYRDKNCVLYHRYDSLMQLVHMQISETSSDTSKIFAIADSLGKVNGEIRKNWAKYSIEVRSSLSDKQKETYDSIMISNIQNRVNRNNKETKK